MNNEDLNGQKAQLNNYNDLLNGSFGASTSNFVQRVMVKVPPLWSEQPVICFAQVEAQFANAAIRSDLSKFNTVVAAIDSQGLGQLSDAILSPPVEDIVDATLAYTGTSNSTSIIISVARVS